MVEPQNQTVQTLSDSVQLSDQQKIAAGMCPGCDGSLSFTEGCKTCFACGWSACSG